jgi:hypothetical protein
MKSPLVPVVLAALVALAACGPRPAGTTVYGRSHNESRVAEEAAADFGCAHETIDVQEIDGKRFVAEGCGQRAVYKLACADVAGTTACRPKLESRESLPE